MTQELHDARVDLVRACTRSSSDEDAESFIRDLHRVANVCTKSNVQHCTAFIIATGIQSSTRTTALCRLLLALSESFEPQDSRKRIDATKVDDCNIGLGKIVNGKVQQPPQPQFKRLHILYVVSDGLLTLHRRARSAPQPESLDLTSLDIIKQYLSGLAALATFTGDQKAAESYPGVLSLLKIWKDEKLLSDAEVASIWAKVNAANSDDVQWQTLLGQVGTEKEEIGNALSRETGIADLVLPERHGVPNDPTAPWHELPATNGLYMKRTRGYPLRAFALPMGGYELDRAGGEPDVDLRSDVQWLHKEMLHAFDKFTSPEDLQDVDALGNIIYKDPDRPTRNYWGWSLDGVSKMHEMSKHDQETATGYDDIRVARASNPMDQVNAAVERARSLAAERTRGRGGNRGARSWRGGRRW